ncbi:MAG: hypothetical protein U5O39_11735 [Gammaproteobacteria bacterium]|nr:hypothetical protein [Gammaproteobacteria bacterium]
MRTLAEEFVDCLWRQIHALGEFVHNRRARRVLPGEWVRLSPEALPLPARVPLADRGIVGDPPGVRVYLL